MVQRSGASIRLAPGVRRGSVIQLVAIGLIAGAICTAVALMIPWLPVAGGPGGRPDPLRLLVRDRHLRSSSSRSSPRSSSTRGLEVPRRGRTTCPTARRPTATPRSRSCGRRSRRCSSPSISIVSAIVLAKNGDAGANPRGGQGRRAAVRLAVHVPERQDATATSRSPKAVTPSSTSPRRTSSTRSGCPSSSQKQDAVPGEHNTIVITPTRTGTYPVICTELCGLGHSVMRSHVTIVIGRPVRRSSSRAAGRRRSGPPGLAVFQKNGCGSCHTLQAAGRDRQDRPRPRQARRSRREGESRLARGVHPASRSSIRARTSSPATPDLMPHTFKSQIPPAELDQLVQYLVEREREEMTTASHHSTEVHAPPPPGDGHPPVHARRLAARALDDAALLRHRARASSAGSAGSPAGTRSGTACRSSPSSSSPRRSASSSASAASTTGPTTRAAGPRSPTTTPATEPRAGATTSASTPTTR